MAAPLTGDGVSRREFLAATTVAGLSALTVEVGAACRQPVVTAPPSGDGLALTLRAHATPKGIIFGTATGTQHLNLDDPFKQLVLGQSGMLAPEIELKWAFLSPQPGLYRFEMADIQLQLATAQGVPFRGHTLVWHTSMPPWFAGQVTAQNAEQVLRDHIAMVAGRYAGKMHSWDVVNEPLLLSDGRPDGLRITPWLDLLGPDYIAIAFDAAAKADPSALLLLAENSLEYSFSTGITKRQKMFELVQSLRGQGLRVDGLALQGHLLPDLTFLNQLKLRTFLADAAALNLAIVISELDVSDDSLPPDVLTRDSLVSDIYQAFLEPVLDEPAVKAIVSWGLSDRYSWLAGYRPRADGLGVRPLPFDTLLQPKTSHATILRMLDQAVPR